VAFHQEPLVGPGSRNFHQFSPGALSGALVEFKKTANLAGNANQMPDFFLVEGASFKGLAGDPLGTDLTKIEDEGLASFRVPGDGKTTTTNSA
jgi:hypothetical protein